MTQSASISPQEFAAIADRVTSEVQRVIVGQRTLVNDVLTCLFAEGHALLEGLPGLGKTKLLSTLAQVVGLEFRRIQFTPDLMPADIVGTHVLRQGEDGHRGFHFEPGPVFANLVLADEINRATPKTQSALLEAMAERSVTVSGETHRLTRPFLVMATQNPIELEGTYPLPEAQLDRFMLKAMVEFPEADDLATILSRTTGVDEPRVNKVVDAQQLVGMADLTRSVAVADHVARHIVDIVVATHPERDESPDVVKRYLRFGASPRGAQSITLAGKVRALRDGRTHLSIEDVRSMTTACLRHRVQLKFEAEIDGVGVDQVLDQVLAAVPAPTSGVRGAP